MFPGMGGKINPKQIQALMRQFGIKSESIPAKRVVFELEGKRMVIDAPQVNAIDAQGQKMYQVMGEMKEEKGKAGGGAGKESAGEGKEGIPEEDVKMVMEQAGAKKAEAVKALKETNGDIAEAIVRLKK